MVNNNQFYSSILEKNNIYFSEDQFIAQVRTAMKKMQMFLLDHEVTISLKEIKQKTRIEIKGVADNGKERELQQELIEKYGIDILEESEGYNTLFPWVKEGVIMCKTEKMGIYYTHFIVEEKTDEQFDLKLYDYILYNNAFYLQHLVYIEGLSKKIPIGETYRRSGGIQSFFLNHFSRQDLKDFSDSELDAIKAVIPSEAEEEKEIDIVTSITLSVFKVVNFIKEHCKENIKNASLFLDNEFFTIKNWNKNDVESIIPVDMELQVENCVDNIIFSDVKFKIVDIHSMGKIIPQIIQKANIDTFYIAVGFAFQSGLKILESAFRMVKERVGKCELVLGSLQNYDDERANNKIDRQTVSYLNRLVENKDIELFTYNTSFYHGKFYYMCNDEKAFVIIGSSNISKTAFNVNYEMDVVHIMDKGSEQEKQFLIWYTLLREKCKKIETLDENNFGEYNWTSELDAFRSLKNQRISNEEMRKQIEALSDEELKYRLTLWMDKNPTDRYEDIGIEALKDYVMFVYAENGLVVFESFVPGNAYYVFKYRNSLVGLLADIKRMSKTQMACSAHYMKRGYHIRSKEKLAKQIDKYFEL